MAFLKIFIESTLDEGRSLLKDVRAIRVPTFIDTNDVILECASKDKLRKIAIVIL